MTTYSQQDKKRFRTIGHQLRPVITVGNKGLTEQLMQELERALTDHELIKIKSWATVRSGMKYLLRYLTKREQLAFSQWAGWC